MDTLTGMRLFTQVVETGSFSEAARKLGMAPSSISRQISALEDALDARLINRTTRHLSLTEAGQIYYDRVSNILHDVDEANAAVSTLQEEPKGTLRVNLPIAFGNMHIVPLMPKFMEEFPDVKIDLTLTDHYIDLVEEGADVAIRIGVLQDSSYIARKLSINRRVICGSPAYFEAHGEPKSLKDLTNHNCLTYKFPGRKVWQLQCPKGVQELEVDGTFETNNGETLLAATLGGLGIAYVPNYLVGDYINSGRLKTVLMDELANPADVESGIYVIYPYNRHLSAKVRAFVDFVADHFKKNPIKA